jgi:outer membrane beta-barrel protein
MKLARLLCALLLACLAAPLAASAQESGKLVAIQQRKYRMGVELELGGMFEPIDAFSKGLAPEGSLTLHFDDDWGWEVLRGGYVARLNTSLRTQLERDFGVDPTAFDSLQYYASSNLIFSPLYGKFALRNSSLVHMQAFLSFGAAYSHFTSYYAAAPELGAGLRVFLNNTFSVRFDARDAYFFGLTTKKQQNILFLSLGLSINFGGNDG